LYRSVFLRNLSFSYRAQNVAMPPRRVESNIAATRWAVLIVPAIILGIFGFATWAVIDHLCGMFGWRCTAAQEQIDG
jgi:hypothetical protein